MMDWARSIVAVGAAVVAVALGVAVAIAQPAQPQPEAPPEPPPAPPPQPEAQPAPPPQPEPQPTPEPQPEATPEPQPEPPPEATPEPQPEPPTTAADVADAPRPGHTDGVAIEEPKGAKSALLWIPRVLLFVPRWATEVVFSPVRGAAWAYERFDLRNRARRIFFNDTGTFGMYPVGFVETGFGLNIGGRAIHRDLLGAGEHLRLRASYGGRFRQIYALELDSGERLGPVELELDAELEFRPKDKFFGIGNGDAVDPPGALPGDLIDPLADDTATETRFQQDVFRISAGADVALGGGFSLGVDAALLMRRFDESEEREAITVGMSYDTDRLIGFADGLSSVYTELELRYDSRRQQDARISAAAPSTGWLLSTYAGYARGFGDDPSDYARYGAEAQRYLNLFRHSRTLALRAMVEGVTGELEDVPFVDLPRLGGLLLLRGYDIDRFRDRALALATAEYMYAIDNHFSGLIFVDAGRVYRSLSELTVDDTRVGFGAGIQFHTPTSFLMRTHISTSIDGGLFFNLSFDPVFDARARTERK